MPKKKTKRPKNERTRIQDDARGLLFREGEGSTAAGLVASEQGGNPQGKTFGKGVLEVRKKEGTPGGVKGNLENRREGGDGSNLERNWTRQEGEGKAKVLG